MDVSQILITIFLAKDNRTKPSISTRQFLTFQTFPRLNQMVISLAFDKASKISPYYKSNSIENRLLEATEELQLLLLKRLRRMIRLFFCRQVLRQHQRLEK